jgi:hypothetical protein
MMDDVAEHPPETREDVVAFAAYALAECPADLDTWLATQDAQDAISALLAELDR